MTRHAHTQLSRANHVDHLNTPRLVADATGTTVWRWDNQEPFGNNPPDENPSGLGAFEFDLRFPGHVWSKETQTAYNGHRDAYDPAIGRYPQSDCQRRFKFDPLYVRIVGLNLTHPGPF